MWRDDNPDHGAHRSVRINPPNFERGNCAEWLTALDSLFEHENVADDRKMVRLTINSLPNKLHMIILIRLDETNGSFRTVSLLIMNECRYPHCTRF